MRSSVSNLKDQAFPITLEMNFIKLEELKDLLRAFVVLSPAGIYALTLAKHFRTLFNKPLPIFRFGYRNFGTFLRKCCSDIFEFKETWNNPLLSILQVRTTIPDWCLRYTLMYNSEDQEDYVPYNPNYGPDHLKVLKEAALKYLSYDSLFRHRAVHCCLLLTNFKLEYGCEGTHELLLSFVEGSYHIEYLPSKDDQETKDECASHFIVAYKPFKKPSPIVRRPTPVSYEEALPFVPYEKGVFPDDCMQYRESIPSLGIADLNVNDIIDVIVGEVYSPWHMWMIRFGEEYYQALDHVMLEMNTYYKGEGRDREMCVGAIITGQNVACCYQGKWHRAEIKEIIDCFTVMVQYIDYGTVKVVEASDLKPLRRCWAQLPAQAIRVRLAVKQPATATLYWDQVAAYHLFDLLHDDYITAKVVALDNVDQVIHVRLGSGDQLMDENIHISMLSKWDIEESLVFLEVKKYYWALKKHDVSEEDRHIYYNIAHTLTDAEATNVLEWVQNLYAPFAIDDSPSTISEDMFNTTIENKTECTLPEYEQRPRLIEF